MEILNTDRLILRTMKKEDFQILYEKIFAHMDVCRYTFGSKGFDFKKTCNFLLQYGNFSSKIGLSTLILKENASIIGLGGAVPCKVLGGEDYEIGFILEKNSWGKGYAREIGQAQIEFIRDDLKKFQALALADPRNKGSIKVINALGFEYIKDVWDTKGLRKVFVKKF